MVKKILQLTVAVLLVIGCVAQDPDPEPESEHHCIWYGECRFHNGHYQNCPYNGSAKVLEDEDAQQKLLELCPNVYEGLDTPVCCDAAQVLSMARQVSSAAGLFKRCSTCMNNFMLGICAMTCAADHSRFITPTILEDNGVEYISEIEYRIDEDFVDNVFDSCKNTILSSTGRPVLDFACAPYNAKTCDAKRWYRFLGDPEINEFVPFKIAYNYLNDDEETAFKASAIPCNESYPGKWACSCLDCPQACPIGDILTGDDLGFIIAGFNGVAFILAIVLGVVGVVVVALCVFLCSQCSSYNPKFFGGFDSVHDVLSSIFRWWGAFCARNPVLILAISSWIIGGLVYGIQYMQITTNPVELWASQDSQTRIEKNYFDSRFGPFYRTNQLFIKPIARDFIYHETPEGNITFGPAYEKEFLTEVFQLQLAIMNIGQTEKAGLEKVCYAPVRAVGEPIVLQKCLIQSIFAFFNHNITKFLAESERDGYTYNYLNTLDTCLTGPMAIDCTAPYGGPIEPAIAVGGFSKFESNSSEFHMATAIVLTFLVQNHNDEASLKPAMEWEYKFLQFMKNYTNSKMDIAFNAERSIQDNIEELSDSETSTVIISYVVMFVYIAIALGKIKSLRYFFMESKIVLAVGGIAIVLLSVLCSLGFWGYIGLETTMLSIEVIPFLVLAIGVDNIFMMVHTFNRVDRIKYPKTSDAIGEAVGHVGPSILLTSASEFSCFAIGGLSEMPAVKTFAVYAAFAIFMDFLLQITAFVALMSLDQKRYEDGRWDLFCCAKNESFVSKGGEKGLLEKLFEKYYAPLLLAPEFVPTGQTITGAFNLEVLKRVMARIRRIRPEYRDPENWIVHRVTLHSLFVNLWLRIKGVPSGTSVGFCQGWGFKYVEALDLQQQPFSTRFESDECDGQSSTSSSLQESATLIHYITPIQLRKNFSKLRPLTIIGFIIGACLSIAVIPSIEPGLDQELSMPENSYIVKYFQYMAELLEMGPPVYWVIKPGINYELRSGQNILCGGQQCYSDSVAMKLYTASKYPEITRFARPASSWIDDYIDWLTVDTCCKMNTTDKSFCPSNSNADECDPCPRTWGPDGLRPSSETFSTYVSYFLSDLPDSQCAKAGRAAYSDGVNYVLDNNSSATVKDSYLMQYSTKSVVSYDFYTALREARKVQDQINEVFKKYGTDATVFPYCVFFVFYEQYLTIWADTLFLLGLSLAAVFVVTLLVTGLDIVSSLIILLMVFLILINMLGLMWLWNITLNAVSLVNLVVSIGIAVEFVSHIVRTYKITSGTALERAHYALSVTGSSVLSGITLTKFAGIIVLAFAKSRIFQIFYFRMYLCIVLMGALNGLVLLPVLLSYFGPKNPTKKSETITLSANEMKNGNSTQL